MGEYLEAHFTQLSFTYSVLEDCCMGSRNQTVWDPRMRDVIYATFPSRSQLHYRPSTFSQLSYHHHHPHTFSSYPIPLLSLHFISFPSSLLASGKDGLLLGLEVVEQNGAFLGFLAPVANDNAGAVDDFSGVAFAIEYTWVGRGF